jgi:8-amino-7-oxononanoate synthase
MARAGNLGGGYGFDAVLADIEGRDLRRRPATLAARDGPVITINDREAVNFCSNDYLGLASHPRLIEAWCRGARTWGTGAGASPLVSGRYAVHEELEQELARITGRERALLFPDGFQANLAVVSALVPAVRGRVLLDRLCHASLIDGVILSRAPFRRFPHADVGALQRRLQEVTPPFCLVISESVFSMDGDLAPLDDYAGLCREYGACLYVDDAHGFGVLGERGRGALEQLSLGQTEVPLLMATFGKALGLAGAFVAGPAVLIETLVQCARPYIYSTAMPPALAAAVLESLHIVAEEKHRRVHLQALIQRFRSEAERLGLPLLPSATPIQPLLLGTSRRALETSEKLLQQGFYVAAIRPPTVPEGSARLRITLTAGHTPAQVDGLLQALQQALGALAA